MKPLQDMEVTEKEGATFVCEISHDEVEAQWYKGDAKLKDGDNIKIRQEGELHRMNFDCFLLESLSVLVEIIVY